MTPRRGNGSRLCTTAAARARTTQNGRYPRCRVASANSGSCTASRASVFQSAGGADASVSVIASPSREREQEPPELVGTAFQVHVELPRAVHHLGEPVPGALQPGQAQELEHVHE